MRTFHLRLKILEFIDRHEVIKINKIYNSMKIEQSITQHLKILKNVGIVDNNKEGKFKHYQIDYDKMEKVVKAINNLLADKFSVKIKQPHWLIVKGL
ncbi:MAG: helix-turn-helix transcriptional regulator [Saprospiraceae bacterium]|nr:helix-turn-helix transcriptional regulator [Saprospiraceae bacterium]